ncbi:MAG: glutamine--fructose-6-phosphate transaminase (isomerizing), partial [Clostridiales bacterium]|nr:glutamine--fructose-6-phosphate transaminase (isomerizing) [Clostridiales bacterium]
MCGIVGYTGKKKAAPILLDGLARLEYRGYDSAGISIRDGDANPVVVKAKGRLKVLSEKTDGGKALSGTCGIGHTRWATHGEPSENNAHPHIVDDYNVVGVHNGIIENYQQLREKMIRKGYTFYSDTDTEVAIKTIDYYYKKYTHDPIEALAKTMVRVRGSYALAVMFKEHPGKIFVARKDSPMIIGVDKDSSYVASDVPAILKYTRNVYYIADLEMACIEPGKATFYNLDGDVIEKEQVVIDWDASAAEKDGFEHFMMKEIHEQPRAVADTLKSVVSPEGEKYVTDLSQAGFSIDEMKAVSQIYIVACGSAYHVGAAAQYVIEEIVHIPVRCELASEFRYRDMPFAADSMVIIISQSGETADSLAALRKCKAAGIKTLAIVNVIGSTIAREADHVLYTMAGPEISVATTKAYSAQLALSYILAIELASAKGTIDEEKKQELLTDVMTIPDKIRKMLEDKERLQWFASKLAAQKDIFFIG